MGLEFKYVVGSSRKVESVRTNERTCSNRFSLISLKIGLLQIRSYLSPFLSSRTYIYNCNEFTPKLNPILSFTKPSMEHTIKHQSPVYIFR